VEIIYGLKKDGGGYVRRRDGTLYVFSTREEAALWANADESVAPLRVVDL
jgi:hypothetical protein